MTDENGQPVERENPTSIRPRRSRRRPIRGTLVAIELASAREDGHWVVDALDVNADGIGVVLPPDLPPGRTVRLTFKLADDCEVVRQTGTVLHHDGQSGGIRFTAWPQHERLKLLEFLVRCYESEDGGDSGPSRATAET